MKNNGCETIDLNQDVPLTDQIEAILGEPMVDCAVDYVGSEAHGIGREAEDMNPAYAINQVMDATRAGGATGIVGVYGPNPLASSKAEQEGTFSLDFGKAWIKSPRITGGLPTSARAAGSSGRAPCELGCQSVDRWGPACPLLSWATQILSEGVPHVPHRRRPWCAPVAARQCELLPLSLIHI